MVALTGDRPVLLTGRGLGIRDVVRVAREGTPVALAPCAERAMARSAAALSELVRGGERLYGMTTGVGALDQQAVFGGGCRAQQASLLRSHAAGVGAPMPADWVRAMMLVRANNLAAGVSGVGAEVPRALVALLNRGVTPEVPSLGSVGASDLAPLAHVGLVLLGEGRARVGAEVVSGAEALRRAGVEVLPLGGRDAFALINGLAHTASAAALIAEDAAQLVEAVEVAAAMSMTALASLTSAIAPAVVARRPHPGSLHSAARLRRLVDGAARAVAADKVREPLSTRCVHHVAGAARDAIGYARQVVEVELASAVDNPMIAPGGLVTNNAGNCHGQGLGDALDFVANAMISQAVMSERRIARLLDPAQSGLPAFLVHPHAAAGMNSGLMIAQYTAAALVAELRTLGVAAGIQSLSTCAGSEDHVPMCALAVRRAARVVELATQVVAIELLAAAQALDVGATLPPPALAAPYAALRGRVPTMIEDRIVADDIAAAAAVVASGALGSART